MLRNRATYEIMKPEDVGLARSNLVLGKHSGRHAFRERVEMLGFHLDDVELNRCFEDFKRLADRKKDMYDRDIEAIIMNVDASKAGPWSIAELHVSAGTGQIAGAAVRLLHIDGHEVSEAAVGGGPVAASFRALERATGITLALRNFDVQGVTDEIDAQGEVIVTVEYNQQSFRGHAVSTDIVEAAALAYLEVLNRILRRQQGAQKVADDDTIAASGPG
jgi:2-isopropylmalate synthase